MLGICGRPNGSFDRTASDGYQKFLKSLVGGFGDHNIGFPSTLPLAVCNPVAVFPDLVHLLDQVGRFRRLLRVEDSREAAEFDCIRGVRGRSDEDRMLEDLSFDSDFIGESFTDNCFEN